MVFIMSIATKVCQTSSQVPCDVVLFIQVADKNNNLSPSAKRLLHLLTLWTLSDRPYLVEVVHRCPFNCWTSSKNMLQSQTAW